MQQYVVKKRYEIAWKMQNRKEPHIAIEMMDDFLTTDFADGRHEERIRKIVDV